LIWQTRNYIETNRFGEAAGILEILRNDPNFPERLHGNLNEMIAYWCYKQNMYDTAASYLSQALDVTTGKLEKARREFLIAQLFELSKNNNEAIKWYTKCAETTNDPIMEVYANLGAIKAAGDTTKNIIDEKLNNLLKMAHRDKYAENRDIIYYAIAQVEIEKKDPGAAEQMLKKSIQFNTEDNPEQRSQSFLLLADINYDELKYKEAKNFYDSVDVSMITDSIASKRINDRQPALATIASDLVVIHDEDSLQTVAAMPKDKRDSYVHKLVRTLRKQQGLKEDEDLSINPAVQQTASDLFNPPAANAANANSSTTASDWYFNNMSLKSTGYNQFVSKWGGRPNTDNWQRLSAINKEQEENNNDDEDSNGNVIKKNIPGENNSNDSAGATTELTFEGLYSKLPLTPEQVKSSNDKIVEALFSNAQAFQNQLEDYVSAISDYELLLNKYHDSTHLEETLFNLYYCYSKVGRKSSADSVRNALLHDFPNGASAAKLNHPQTNSATNENDPATLKYKEIYNLFIEGRFEEAKNEKTKADSIYGNSYWTPQLLYIEAIYYVSKREDSTAIDRLDNLKNMYDQSPLAEKAQTMIDVLHRRGEIESYLTNLKIERDKDDETPVVDLTPVQPTIRKVVVTRDSVKSNNLVTQQAQTTVDTGKVAPAIKTYTFDPKDQQYVVVLLEKVAPVYINEAKNAFNRYNQITFYDQKLNITPVKLDDRYNLVLIGPFTDAVAAVNYVDKTKPQTTSRILPWLTPDKYSYGIISQGNLAIMQETKDVDSYKKLLEKVMPGKF
jgi:tetratricopeptide (TPR) repeat protein